MRPADQAAFDTSVERGFAAAWKGPGVLAVMSDQSSELETWGRAFARRVRAHPGASLEIYMPATREGLIERFNQSLAGLTLDAARADTAVTAARRIILVPDCQAFDSPEGLLLARLVSDFPGAGTRLVVLVERDTSDRAERLVGSLGRGVQRFSLAPDAQSAAVPAFGHAVQEDAPPDLAGRTGPEGIRPNRASVDPEQQVAMLPTAAGAGSGRSSAARWIGVGGLLMALLLVSALIVVLLHRETGPGASFERSPAVDRAKGASNLMAPPDAQVKHTTDGA